MDRLFVGQADVGNLVGLGRTPDVRTDPFLLVYGLYCAAVSSRRASACRQGWRRACTRWRGEHTDYLLFGSMVEHLASRSLCLITAGALHGHEHADRKSGVLGKSGSVRCERGGCRIIKKKK